MHHTAEDGNNSDPSHHSQSPDNLTWRKTRILDFARLHRDASTRHWVTLSARASRKYLRDSRGFSPLLGHARNASARGIGRSCVDCAMQAEAVYQTA
jgi:hypothetical protein